VKWRDWLARLNRVQQGVLFKIIASVVVVGLAIAGSTTYLVRVTAPSGAAPNGAASSSVTNPTADAASGDENAKQQARIKNAIDDMQRLAQEVLSQRASPTNVGVAVAIGTGVVLVVIWLGLGLTYLALAIAAGAIAWPLQWRAIGWTGASTMLLGSIALTASFTALMQVLRLALSGSGAILAVARNVVAEAVRMRVSLVFIVLLILGLATLPLTLDPTTPLRYRVQSFLQFGVGGSFWLVAILTLFLSVATVAFEQRDRQIWQTMTKPVSSWRYIFGKWLGVVGVNAVLLTVCMSGVFMFTEYLRRQPASGEQALETAVGRSATPLTQDRWILETQILTARKVMEPLEEVSKNSSEFDAIVQRYIENGRAANPEFASSAAAVDKIRDDLFKQLQSARRTAGPGGSVAFQFAGLKEARNRGLPLTLRYKVNAGGNRPDELYHVTFFFQGVPLSDERVSPGLFQTITLPAALIDDNGNAELVAINGSLVRGGDDGNQVGVSPNPDSMTFDPGQGLEVSYPAGSFALNLARVGFVLWIKLAFLTMLGCCAATFLSFPVACLVAFATFIAGEGAGFLSASLDSFEALDPMTNTIAWWKVPVRALGLVVAWMFGNYSELQPTSRLVDGRLLSWGAVSYGTVVLVGWVAVLYGIAGSIFRKRELATYSGH
jgi:ABC-type transport system involved in multi-copper enzyme maturation permease subunit